MTIDPRLTLIDRRLKVQHSLEYDKIRAKIRAFEEKIRVREFGPKKNYEMFRVREKKNYFKRGSVFSVKKAGGLILDKFRSRLSK